MKDRSYNYEARHYYRKVGKRVLGPHTTQQENNDTKLRGARYGKVHNSGCNGFFAIRSKKPSRNRGHRNAAESEDDRDHSAAVQSDPIEQPVRKSCQSGQIAAVFEN